MRIMGVARKEMYEPFVEHALGPITRIASELAGQGTCSNLHPDTALSQALNGGVLIIDPRQTFRVRQNRDISRYQNIEEELLKSNRGNVMRWLDKHISAVGNGENAAFLEVADEIRSHMRIRSADEIKLDVRFFQSRAQVIDRAPYLRAVIMIEARKNVRSACNKLNPLSGKHPRHLDRGCEI
jgi:hypothetical protein